MSDDDDTDQMRFGDYNNDEEDPNATGEADVFYLGQNEGGYQSDDDYGEQEVPQ